MYKLTPSYSRVNIRYAGKFYAPVIFFIGKKVYLKSIKETATDALNWATKFCEKWDKLHA